MTPRGFAPRSPPHALSRAAASARSVRVGLLASAFARSASARSRRSHGGGGRSFAIVADWSSTELVSKPIAGGRERGAPRPAAGPSPVTALVGPRRPWGCSRTGPAPDTVLKPVLVVREP